MKKRVQSLTRRCCQSVLMGLVASVGITGCSLANLQLEENNAKVDALSVQVEANVRTTEQVLDSLASLQEQSEHMSPEFSALREELASLNRAQARIEKLVIDKTEIQTPSVDETVVAHGEKMVLGRVEWLWLPQLERYFSVQVDTGLSISLLFADDIMFFERDGERWLRFSIERQSWPSVMEAKLLRSDKVDITGGSSIKGQIVSLPVKLAHFSDDIEFLVTAKKQRYPQIVLGKNLLTDIALVDVSEKYRVQKQPEFVRAEGEQKRLYEESVLNQEVGAKKDELKGAAQADMQTTKG